MTTLHLLTATRVLSDIRAGKTSPIAYLDSCLARIASREPLVHAFTQFDPDLVRRRARHAPPGPLHGIPFAVKDVLDTADQPSEYGSPIWDGHRPFADAASVAWARAAGAVLMGKTVTTEFATRKPGATANPAGLSHTPGGSSSGSAAAVADCMVPLATGTQTLGSIVRPAAFCGVVGYKPTYNLIPRKGVWNDADTLDTVGVFARSVPDAALFVAAMLDFRALMVPDRPAVPRVGLCRTFQWEHASPDMQAALANAGRHLQAAGASVEDVALPPRYADLLAAQTCVAKWEIAHTLADEYLRNGTGLRPPLYERCSEGYKIDPADYQRALATGRQCRQMLPDAFGHCDVLLAPGAPGEAPEGLEWTGDPLFNQIWTFLHVPCVAVRGGRGGHGLPLGLQVIGRLDDDSRTLEAAHWIQLALDERG